MIADWETNGVFVADTFAHRHPDLFRDLARILDEFGVPSGTVVGTTDIWIRDAAPVQVGEGDFVQFAYWPDYLRKGYQHLITGPEVFRDLPMIKNVERSELIIDGGNVVGTAQTAILTDKVFRENPDRSPDEIEDELRRLLQVERVIFIPREPYDLIGHVDGMVRFIGQATVVANDYTSLDPDFGHRLLASLQAAGIEVETLPYRPERKRYDGIESAVGNFVNYLRVSELIILPAYGLPEDEKALLRLRRLCPHANVLPLDCTELAREGGVLQCTSWTMRLPGPRSDYRPGSGMEPGLDEMREGP